MANNLGDPQIQEALRKFFDGYDAESKVSDEYINSLSEKYAGKENELWRKLYDAYDPESNVSDDYISQITQAYKNPFASEQPEQGGEPVAQGEDQSWLPSFVPESMKRAMSQGQNLPQPQEQPIPPQAGEPTGQQPGPFAGQYVFQQQQPSSQDIVSKMMQESGVVQPQIQKQEVPRGFTEEERQKQLGKFANKGNIPTVTDGGEFTQEELNIQSPFEKQQIPAEKPPIAKTDYYIEKPIARINKELGLPEDDRGSFPQSGTGPRGYIVNGRKIEPTNLEIKKFLLERSKANEDPESWKYGIQRINDLYHNPTTETFDKEIAWNSARMFLDPEAFNEFKLLHAASDPYKNKMASKVPAIKNELSRLFNEYVDQRNKNNGDYNKNLATLYAQYRKKEEDGSPQYQLDDIKSRIEYWTRVKEGFFNLSPNEQAKSIESEIGRKEAVDQIPGKTPYERMQNLYWSKLEEYNDIRAALGDPDDNALETLGKALYRGTIGGADTGLDRLYKLQSELRTLAPVVLLNRSPQYENEGFFESALRGFATSTLGQQSKAVVGETRQEKSANIMKALSEAGIKQEELSKGTMAEIEKSAKDSDFWSRQHFGELSGTLTGFIGDMFIGSKGVGLASKFIRAGARGAGLRRTALAMNRLAGLTEAKGFTGFMARVADYAIKTGATGQIFAHQKGEANLTIGLFGGLAGEIGEGLVKLIGPRLAMWFGAETPQILAKVANLGGKGATESVQETFEEVGGIVDKTGFNKEFWTEWNKRFGEPSQALRFYFDTFLMGMAFGLGDIAAKTPMGEEYRRRMDDAKGKLSEEEIANADQVIQELADGQRKVTEVLAPVVDDEKGKKTEPVSESTEGGAPVQETQQGQEAETVPTKEAVIESEPAPAEEAAPQAEVTAEKEQVVPGKQEVPVSIELTPETIDMMVQDGVIDQEDADDAKAFMSGSTDALSRAAYDYVKLQGEEYAVQKQGITQEKSVIFEDEKGKSNIIQTGPQEVGGVQEEAGGDNEEEILRGSRSSALTEWMDSFKRNIRKEGDDAKEERGGEQVDSPLNQISAILGRIDRERENVRTSARDGEITGEKTDKERGGTPQERGYVGQQTGELGVNDGTPTFGPPYERETIGNEDEVVSGEQTAAGEMVNKALKMLEVRDYEGAAQVIGSLQEMLQHLPSREVSKAEIEIEKILRQYDKENKQRLSSKVGEREKSVKAKPVKRGSGKETGASRDVQEYKEKVNAPATKEKAGLPAMPEGGTKAREEVRPEKEEGTRFTPKGSKVELTWKGGKWHNPKGPLGASANAKATAKFEAGEGVVTKPEAKAVAEAKVEAAPKAEEKPVVGKKVEKKPEAKEAVNWRQAYKESNAYKRSAILRKIAEMSKSDAELSDVLGMLVKGAPDESRVAFAVATNPNSSEQTFEKAVSNRALRKSTTDENIQALREKRFGKKPEAKVASDVEGKEPAQKEKPVVEKKEVVLDALKDVESTAKALMDSDYESVAKIKFPRRAIPQHKIVPIEHGGYQSERRVTASNENKLQVQGFGTILTASFLNKLIENGRLNRADFKGGVNQRLTERYATQLLNENEDLFPQNIAEPRPISEAYHKAKADGSNPELVKAVEELLGKSAPSKKEVEKKEPAQKEKPVSEKKIPVKGDKVTVTTGYGAYQNKVQGVVDGMTDSGNVRVKIRVGNEDTFVEVGPEKVEAGGQSESQSLADKIRGAKIDTKGKAFDATIGLPVSVWNAAVELVAKAVEGGVAAAEAIQRGLKYIQKNHRGAWNKKAYNDRIIEELGLRGINVNGEDILVKPVDDKISAEVVNGLYSPLEDAIGSAKRDKSTGKEWKRILDGATEAEEWKWTGLGEYMEDGKTYSKSDLLSYMKDNRVEVVEKVLTENEPESKVIPERYVVLDENGMDAIGETFSREEAEEIASEEEGWSISLFQDEDIVNVSKEDNAPKFSQYQLPGEKSGYKELLVLLPNRDLDRVSEYNQALSEQRRFITDIVGIINIPTQEQRATAIELQRKVDAAKNNLPSDAVIGQNGATIQRNQFTQSHFAEPNVIVHLRMNTRKGTNGEKVLFLEEVQSDWGQKGKKEGFAKKIEAKKSDDGIGYVVYENGRRVEHFPFAKSEEEAIEFATEEGVEGSIITPPSAPFVTDTNAWVKLGLKFALKEAVAQNADAVAWTTGEQQNERYDLSKQVDEVGAKLYSDGTYGIVGRKDGNAIFEDNAIPENKLADYVGKELAEKIITNASKEQKWQYYEGNDLKVGGKGMKAFYGDTKNPGIVGSVAESLVKDLTGEKGKVGSVEIDAEGTVSQPSIPITPELKASVKEGMPTFGSKLARARAKAKAATEALSDAIRDASKGAQMGLDPKATLKVLRKMFKHAVAHIELGAYTLEQFIKDIIAERDKINPKAFTDKQAEKYATDIWNNRKSGGKTLSEIAAEKSEPVEVEFEGESVEKGGDKTQAFYENIDKTRLPDDVKEKIKEEGNTYVPKGIALSYGQATSLVELMGLDWAINNVVLKDGANILPDVKNAVASIVIDKLRVAREEAAQRGDQKLIDEINKQYYPIVDAIADFNTELGRGINAAKLLYMLPGDLQERVILKQNKDAINNAANANKRQVKKDKAALETISNDAAKATADAVLKDERIDALERKISEQERRITELEKEGKETESKGAAKKKSTAKKIADSFLKLADEYDQLSNQANTFGLLPKTAAKILRAIANAINLGININEAINRSIELVPENEKKNFDVNAFRANVLSRVSGIKEASSAEVKRNIRDLFEAPKKNETKFEKEQRYKSIREKLAKLIHETIGAGNKGKNLATVLENEYGFDSATAKNMADAIKAEFSSQIGKLKKAEIKGKFSAEGRKSGRIDRYLDKLAKGDLTESILIEQIAIDYGVEPITPEKWSHIQSLLSALNDAYKAKKKLGEHLAKTATPGSKAQVAEILIKMRKAQTAIQIATQKLANSYMTRADWIEMIPKATAMNLLGIRTIELNIGANIFMQLINRTLLNPIASVMSYAVSLVTPVIGLGPTPHTLKYNPIGKGAWRVMRQAVSEGWKMAKVRGGDNAYYSSEVGHVWSPTKRLLGIPAQVKKAWQAKTAAQWNNLTKDLFEVLHGYYGNAIGASITMGDKPVEVYAEVEKIMQIAREKGIMISDEEVIKLSEKEREKYFTELLDFLIDPDAETIERVKHAGKVATFKEGGLISQVLMSIAGGIRNSTKNFDKGDKRNVIVEAVRVINNTFLNIIMPYVQVPINLMELYMKILHPGLNLVSVISHTIQYQRSLKQDKPDYKQLDAVYKSIGLLVFASAVAALNDWLDDDDIVAGASDDRDEADERMIRKAIGFDSGTINMSGIYRKTFNGDGKFQKGDFTIPTQILGPFGMALQGHADRKQDNKGEEKIPQTAFGKVIKWTGLSPENVAMMAKTMINQSYMRGLKDASAAISTVDGIDRFNTSIMRTFLTAMLPGGRTTKTLLQAPREYKISANLLDEYEEVEQLEAIISDVVNPYPNLPISYNALTGEPEKTDGIIKNLFDFTKGKTVTEDENIIKFWDFWLKTGMNKDVSPSYTIKDQIDINKVEGTTLKLTPIQQSERLGYIARARWNLWTLGVAAGRFDENRSLDDRIKDVKKIWQDGLRAGDNEFRQSIGVNPVIEKPKSKKPEQRKGTKKGRPTRNK